MGNSAKEALSNDAALREELSLEVANSDDPFLEHEITADSVARICDMSESISHGRTFDKHKEIQA